MEFLQLNAILISYQDHLILGQNGAQEKNKKKVSAESEYIAHTNKHTAVEVMVGSIRKQRQQRSKVKVERCSPVTHGYRLGTPPPPTNERSPTCPQASSTKRKHTLGHHSSITVIRNYCAHLFMRHNFNQTNKCFHGSFLFFRLSSTAAPCWAVTMASLDMQSMLCSAFCRTFLQVLTDCCV